MRPRKALVTGHAGFIGRHVARRLLELGYQVTGVDLVEDHGSALALTSLRQDARDLFRYGGKSYDLVVHCAAVVGGRVKLDGAPLEVAVDLAIDAELFQWVLRTRPGAVIYFSSSAAYPTDKQLDLEPRERLAEYLLDTYRHGTLGMPDQTYGWAKVTGEKLAAIVNHQHGIPVHVLRPFSGYGTDQALDYPFPSFIQRALRRDDPFEVWGDGEQVRDFIHVDDVVDGALAMVEHGVTEPVNLCTGVGTSFNELARLVTDRVGYVPRLKHRLDAPVGVRHRVGDPTEMLRFYAPRITLAEGVDRAIRSLV